MSKNKKKVKVFTNIEKAISYTGKKKVFDGH